MGASATVNVDETPDTAGWFLEQNEGLGYDVVFEMSGSPRAIADSFRIARNGGRVILFGIPARPVEIDVAQALIFKNLSVLALNGRKIFETWYRTRWLLESGVVDVRPLITKELPLEEYEEAFALLAAGEACKIVVYPGGRAPAEAAEPLRERVPLEGRWQHDDVDARRSARRRARPRSARPGTYKRFNTLCSPQGPLVEMEGRGEVLVLSSNNYLGLADRPEVVEAGIEGLRRYGAGTASVRFICGTFEPHLELERELADLVGTEAALTYVSCWNANEAAIPSLTDDSTVILSDELNHASIIDAVRLARPARKAVYKHSDMDDLRAQLEVARAGAARARDHRRRLLDGGRPGEAARARRAGARARLRRSSSTTRTAPA